MTRSRRLTPELRQALVDLGRVGGQTRAKNLSSERRREIATLAAQTRWKDHVPKAKQQGAASKRKMKKRRARRPPRHA